MLFGTPRLIGCRILLSLFLLVGLTHPAFARDFIEIDTPYFTVVSSISEDGTRKLIEEMRAFQANLASFTAAQDFRPHKPFRIYLIQPGDWLKYFSTTRGMAGVMIQRRYDYLVLMRTDELKQAQETLYHEYVHFVLRNGIARRRYPSWVDEGFAELMSSFDIGKGKIVFGAPQPDRLYSLANLGPGKWLPLKQVLASDSSVQATDGRHSYSETLGFYAQSWALVHYIYFETPRGASGLIDYLTLRWNGVSIDDAFLKSFGVTVDQMEEALKRYVTRTRFKVLNRDPATLKLPNFGEMKARQLSTTASELELGKLIATLNPKELMSQAERHLKSEPKSSIARAEMANALAMVDEFEKAQSQILDALAVDGKNPEILLMAGDIQSIQARHSSTTADVRDRLLRKAFDYYDLALRDPYDGQDDLQIVAQYANGALQYGESLDRALMQVERMRARYRTEPQIAEIHARLLIEKNLPAEAREAWAVVADYGFGRQRVNAIEQVEKLDAQLRKK